MGIDTKPAVAVSAIIGVATGIYMVYLYVKKYQKQESWIPVATVAKLYVHPIKSCKGVLVDEFTSCKPGVMLPGSPIGDRNFMVVCGQERRFATIRQFHQMALIEPTVIGNDTLLLNAPGMTEFMLVVPEFNPENEVSMYKVFGEECPGVDCGDGVAEWFAEYLGVEIARLVYHHKELPNNKRKKQLGFSHLGVYGKEPVTSVFQDFSPFNVLSDASMNALNEKIENKLTERSFRPNVLLTGISMYKQHQILFFPYYLLLLNLLSISIPDLFFRLQCL